MRRQLRRTEDAAKTCPHCGELLPDGSNQNWQVMCPKPDCLAKALREYIDDITKEN